MKLSLPVYGKFMLGQYTFLMPEILGSDGLLVVDCGSQQKASELYSTFGIITYNTSDVVSQNVDGSLEETISIEKCKFKKMTPSEMKAFYLANADLFREE